MGILVSGVLTSICLYGHDPSLSNTSEDGIDFECCIFFRFRSKKLFPKKMTAATAPPLQLVTTRRRTYEAASVCIVTSRSFTNGNIQLPAPSPASASTVDGTAVPMTTTCRPTAGGSVPVCRVPYDALPASFVSKYELLRRNDGMYRFVQLTSDGFTYDVNYFNAELKRVIPLGRYTDAATASLAHAIARDNDTCRSTNYAAADVIETCYAQSFSQPAVTLPLPTTTLTDGMSTAGDLDYFGSVEDLMDLQSLLAD